MSRASEFDDLVAWFDLETRALLLDARRDARVEKTYVCDHNEMTRRQKRIGVCIFFAGLGRNHQIFSLNSLYEKIMARMADTTEHGRGVIVEFVDPRPVLLEGSMEDWFEIREEEQLLAEELSEDHRLLETYASEQDSCYTSSGICDGSCSQYEYEMVARDLRYETFVPRTEVSPELRERLRQHKQAQAEKQKYREKRFARQAV